MSKFHHRLLPPKLSKLSKPYEPYESPKLYEPNELLKPLEPKLLPSPLLPTDELSPPNHSPTLSFSGCSRFGTVDLINLPVHKKRQIMYFCFYANSGSLTGRFSPNFKSSLQK